MKTKKLTMLGALTGILLGATFAAVAGDFAEGTVISSRHVNEHFAELHARIAALESVLGFPSSAAQIHLHPALGGARPVSAIQIPANPSDEARIVFADEDDLTPRWAMGYRDVAGINAEGDFVIGTGGALNVDPKLVLSANGTLRVSGTIISPSSGFGAVHQRSLSVTAAYALDAGPIDTFYPIPEHTMTFAMRSPAVAVRIAYSASLEAYLLNPVTGRTCHWQIRVNGEDCRTFITSALAEQSVASAYSMNNAICFYQPAGGISAGSPITVSAHVRRNDLNLACGVGPAAHLEAVEILDIDNAGP